MKSPRNFACATVGALIVGGLFAAAPAHAADTPVTMEVVGGSLSISVPASSDLGDWTNVVGGGTLSAPLGQVQVNDARSAPADSGWVATVIMAALTPTAGPEIPATAIGYTVGSITKVGTAIYAGSNRASIEGVGTVVTATGITGDNSATWNPLINVTVPGGMAAGSYTAVITHSVS